MNQTPFLTAFLNEKSLLNDENFQDFLLIENIQLKRVDYDTRPQIEKRGDEIILICSYDILFHDFLEVLFQYYIFEFPEGIPENHDFYQLIKKLKKLHKILQNQIKFSDERYAVFSQKMNQLSAYFSQPCKIFYDAVVVDGDIKIGLLENTPFEIIVQGFQNEIEHIITIPTHGVIDENQLFEDPNKHFQIAKYYFEKGDYQSADIVCNQIIEQYESQPKITVGAWFLLGEIAYHQGDFSGSQALFEKVFFLDTEYRRDEFLCYMGRIFSKQKNIRKLKAVLDEMTKNSLISVEFYQLQAIYHLLGKNFNEIMNTYKTGLEHFPDSQELMYDLGCVYVKVFHNFDIGYQITLKVIKKNIKNISYWELLKTCFKGLDWYGAQEIVGEVIYILENGFPKIKNERGIFLFECLESGNIDEIFELIFQKNTMEKRKR